MRPRNVLLAACPWLTREEASVALRSAGGDVETAKRAASAARRGHQKQTEQPSSSSDLERDGAGVSHNYKAGSEKTGGGERSLPVLNASSSASSVAANDSSRTTNTNDSNDSNAKSASLLIRAPPRHTAAINNLSDRQYCCVWSVEVYDDGYRPDVARTLLATVARHVNPILRERGWRVKRLIESASTQWIGLCTANGRNDADAASTNIQLNLRIRPDRKCKQFRSFQQILSIALHEITHTSIGLEDIHPPAFWELLNQIKVEYKQKLGAGEVDKETDDYGCKSQFISTSGELSSVATSASDILGTKGLNNLGLLSNAGSEGDCGASKRRRRRGGWKRSRRNNSAGFTSNVPKNKEKRRPLLKGTKMIDKRTKVGKATMAERENLSARELAARAALARFDNTPAPAATGNSLSESEDEVESLKPMKGDIVSSGEDDDYDIECIDEEITTHNSGCGCRSCDWSKLFNLE